MRLPCPAWVSSPDPAVAVGVDALSSGSLPIGTTLGCGALVEAEVEYLEDGCVLDTEAVAGLPGKAFEELFGVEVAGA